MVVTPAGIATPVSPAQLPSAASPMVVRPAGRETEPVFAWGHCTSVAPSFVKSSPSMLL